MSKGSRPRPFSIPLKDLDAKHEAIFGKRTPKEQYVPPPLPSDFYEVKEENDTKS
jgi:hypothetical protein